MTLPVTTPRSADPPVTTNITLWKISHPPVRAVPRETHRIVTITMTTRATTMRGSVKDFK
jgi:hypothetical protein